MTAAELRARRERLGLSLAQLAAQLRLRDRSTVWRWENGHRGIPPFLDLALETLERRADCDTQSPQSP